MLKDGGKMIVSLSGGPDSVCLFNVLLELRKKYKFQMQAAYFNHNLRGKESLKEERFVRKMIEKTTIPLTVTALDVKGYAKSRKTSIEEAARFLRYQNLVKLAVKLNADMVAMGHTASDQAETILMRIMRGSGPEGLEGIPPVRKLVDRVCVIRPLIEVYREEIIKYLKSKKIEYCIDSSNLKPVYLRNKVRLKLLPFMEKNFTKDIRSKLVNIADIFREENRFFLQIVDKAMRSVVKQENGRISIDFVKLLGYSKSLRRRIIHGILEGRTSYKNIEAVINIAEAGATGSVIDIPGYTVRKDYRKMDYLPVTGKIAIKKKAEAGILFPGITRLPEFMMEIETGILRTKPVFGNDKFCAYFDADRIDTGKLTIRSRRNGDRFLPFGADGSKKLKQYFIDMKVPSYLRDDVPVLEDGKRILWIVGMRQAEDARVTGNTKRILRIKVRKKEGLNNK